jgi:hypothetical protein
VALGGTSSALACDEEVPVANPQKQPASQPEGLSQQEIDAQASTELPNRDAMSLLDQSLLDLNVDLNLGVDAAAPIDAAAAANVNLAAPIDASVSANIGTVGSTSVASADQTSVIVQNLDGVADATADQTSTINQ